MKVRQPNSTLSQAYAQHGGVNIYFLTNKVPVITPHPTPPPRPAPGVVYLSSLVLSPLKTCDQVA